MEISKGVLEQIHIQSKCLVALNREAHKKFGDNIHSMQMKSYQGDRFVGIVKTKDGKTHRMTIKL